MNEKTDPLADIIALVDRTEASAIALQGKRLIPVIAAMLLGRHMAGLDAEEAGIVLKDFLEDALGGDATMTIEPMADQPHAN